jgi:hypothetical protein
LSIFKQTGNDSKQLKSFTKPFPKSTKTHQIPNFPLSHAHTSQSDKQKPHKIHQITSPTVNSPGEVSKISIQNRSVSHHQISSLMMFKLLVIILVPLTGDFIGLT